jgi:hypothetical protein
MRSKTLSFTISITFFVCMGCSSANKRYSSKNPSAEIKPSVREEVLKAYTKGWPDSSALAARKLIGKYGDPTESTASMLLWKGVLPVKRIIVYRDEVIHQFPTPHKDVIEHVVAYKIPIRKARELVTFDGSLIFDRTRGELSARSNDEAMNYLMLNLASDIITSKRNANSARREYEKLAVDYLNGKISELTQRLQFNTQTNTAYADQATKYNWAHADEYPTEKEKQRLLRQAQEEEITE